MCSEGTNGLMYTCALDTHSSQQVQVDSWSYVGTSMFLLHMLHEKEKQ